MTVGSSAATSLASPDEDLAERLRARLVEVLADADVQVEQLARLSAGASLQTWSVVIRDGVGSRRRIVLRRDSPREPRPGGMQHEALALAAATAHGVPGPALLDWSGTDQLLGAPYLLMEHVDGETIPRRILRDSEFSGARRSLISQLGEALARIHQVPLAQVSSIPSLDPVSSRFQDYVEMDVPRPVLDLSAQWLQDNRPPASSRCLVHGDFRLGNIIVDSNGLQAVLDWELVHLGDPMEDLGYLGIRAWRFGGPLPVAGVGTWSELFNAYEAVAGVRPDVDVVRWWQVAGTFTWATLCLKQGQRYLSGASRSVELAAVGRRVAEQELDLLRMIDSPTRLGEDER